MSWRQRGSLWLLEPPAAPARGVIQFIGGSYLAATPQLSYRRLLEALTRQGLAIQAWSYVPGLITRPRPMKPGNCSARRARSGCPL